MQTKKPENIDKGAWEEFYKKQLWYGNVDGGFVFLSLCHNIGIQGHQIILKPNSATGTDERKWLFSQHVTNLWNSLTQDEAKATGLDCFKGKCDKFNGW